MLWWIVILMGLAMTWAAVRKPRAAPAGLYCMTEDDSDVKIAGQERTTPPEEEAARAAAELERCRQNGDLERARTLGRHLARRMMAEDISAYCGGSVAGRVHLHCRLLLSCTAYGAFAAHLPGKVLEDVARLAFNETLEAEYPNLYKQMTDSGALSFYMLCLRGGGDPSEELGRTFARLTDREGDAAAIRDGAGLYRAFIGAVAREAETRGLKR